MSCWEEVNTFAIRAGVRSCHSKGTCSFCCHDVKKIEEVDMCATIAGVRKKWRTRVRFEMSCRDFKGSEEVNMCASRASVRKVSSFVGRVS